MPHPLHAIADYAAHKVLRQCAKGIAEGAYDKILTVCTESDKTLHKTPEYRRVLLAYLARQATKCDPASAEDPGGLLEVLLKTFQGLPATDKSASSRFFELELEIRAQAVMARVSLGSQFDAALSRMFPEPDTAAKGAPADELDLKNKLALFRHIATGGPPKKGDAQGQLNHMFARDFRQAHSYAELLKHFLAYLGDFERALPAPALSQLKKGNVPAPADEPITSGRVTRNQLVHVFEDVYHGDRQELFRHMENTKRDKAAPAAAARKASPKSRADEVVQRVKELQAASKSLKGKGKDPLDEITTGRPSSAKRSRQEVEDDDEYEEERPAKRKNATPPKHSTPRPHLSPARGRQPQKVPTPVRSPAVHRDLNSSGTRARRVWTQQEVDALRRGVQQLGVGQWAKIREMFIDILAHRSSVDLKDKWRNLQ